MATGGDIFVFADKAIAFAQHDNNRVAPASAASGEGCGEASPQMKKGVWGNFFPQRVWAAPTKIFLKRTCRYLVNSDTLESWNQIGGDE